MNYELAKQLKDAGFPHTWCSEDDCSCLSTEGNHTFCYPTLSDLIQVCGDGFVSLNKGMFPNQWMCLGNGVQIGGSSPEEAVARLWLALNKK